MRLRRWVRLYITVPIALIIFIFSFNFVIDPYSMTAYNLLDIPNKFARDDRKEKVAKLYTEPAYANMLFGSSHVYTINPLMVEKYVGGRSYNAGVGTARIEDHLGFLLFLKRIDKLPKNIILGLDFYSFNPNVETNKYFLVNDELNFLQQRADSDLYFSKFLSIDALRASYKTLSNFLQESSDKPRFDSYGTALNASKVFTYYPETVEKKEFDIQAVEEGYKSIKTIRYEQISRHRLQYLRDIVRVCRDNSISCTFFITPLNGQLLSKIEQDPALATTLKLFKRELAGITDYYDFLTHNEINDNRFFFGGDTMHTTPFTGNLMLARIFGDADVTLPKEFGVYVPSLGAHP
jgi:hypothetical protein